MDESDPLSDTSGHPDLGNRGTNDYPTPSYQHDLILGQNLHHANDIARLFGLIDGDNPLPTAPLNAVVVDVGAFAESALGDDKDCRVPLDHDHADQRIALPE